MCFLVCLYILIAYVNLFFFLDSCLVISETVICHAELVLVPCVLKFFFLL